MPKDFIVHGRVKVFSNDILADWGAEIGRMMKRRGRIVGEVCSANNMQQFLGGLMVYL